MLPQQLPRPGPYSTTYSTQPTHPQSHYPPHPSYPIPHSQGQAPARQSDVPAANSNTAAICMTRLIAIRLDAAGFSSSHPQAFERLQSEIVALLEHLYRDASNYANLSNRASPSILDMLEACGRNDIQPNQLKKMIRNANRKRKRDPSLSLVGPHDRAPSPELLHSDDDISASHVPPTLRYLPPHFPPLPPRHTYLRTPVSSTAKKTLPSLEKKLANAALVQESLKSLIIATEDNSGPEDADLVGHVVNWESSVSSRKRWRW